MAIKTVKCAACGAEQAILRDEEGKMNCVFCGEPVELPEYEEGEGMDYEYETPVEEKKEEPMGEKIDATFVLSEQEVATAFTVSGKLKERKFLVYIELALLFLFGTGILIMSILGLLGKAGASKPGMIDWLYVVLCYAMIPIVITMPARTKRKLVRKATSGNQLTVSVYENLLNIHIKDREEKDDWQQPFDGSYGLIDEQGLFVLTLKNGQILVIPHRSLTEEQIGMVKDRLQTKS